MRKEGWEIRYVDVLERARHAPYKLGEHDCFNVLCDVWTALLGQENQTGAKWRHAYSTETEAVALIAQHGPFVEAFSQHFFGGPPVDVSLARRGDAVAYKDERRRFHVGICVGNEIALLAPTGLTFLPLASGHCAWRIE